VSQQVQQLEEAYQCRLLARTTHGVFLTESGEALYRYVNKLLRTIHESREALATLNRRDVPRLTIGASLTIAEYVLPKVLGNLYHPEPQDRLSVMMANSRTVFDQVLNDVVDVGLIETELRSPQLVVRRFADDFPVVVVSSHHAWKERATVTLEEFLVEPIIIREPGSGTRVALEQALDYLGLGIEDLSVRLVLGTTQAIKAMVASGIGATVVSPLAILPAEQHQFHTVSVSGLNFLRSFFVIHKRDAVPPAGRRLIQALTVYGRGLLSPNLNIMPAHSPSPAKPGGGQACGGLLAALRGFSLVP
jgi:DNA-binding transcriptional LysR family regulator